jgi:dolichyl-phosphate-mannose--protein O-mannosyl transferase
MDKIISRYFMGENVQIIAACSTFLVVGLLGAKFYEKMKQEKDITEEEKSSYYTREQMLRFVAYVFGIAPLVILMASVAYGAAGAADLANKNHRFVYLLYAFVGFLGVGFSAMIFADISKYVNKNKKSTFGADATATAAAKPEKSETEKAVQNAKIIAIVGLVIFVSHVFLSLIFAISGNTNEVFSLNALKSLQQLAGGNKSSTYAAPATTTTGFGMNDLLSFGKRRRRY